MTRRVLAAALLALLAGTPLDAGLGRSKAVFTCGTDPARAGRIEGRLETWNVSALTFTPDVRDVKPLLIRYRNITRLVFGSTPGPRADAVLRPACRLKSADRYLTIFYTVSSDAAETGTLDSTASREKDRRDRQDRTHQKDQAARDQEKDKEKEHIAVFQLGETVLRPTLRIIATRSRKIVTYLDTGARRAAR